MKNGREKKMEIYIQYKKNERKDGINNKNKETR
jgi:hypothetical protein